MQKPPKRRNPIRSGGSAGRDSSRRNRVSSRHIRSSAAELSTEGWQELHFFRHHGPYQALTRMGSDPAPSNRSILPRPDGQETSPYCASCRPSDSDSNHVRTFAVPAFYYKMRIWETQEMMIARNLIGTKPRSGRTLSSGIRSSQSCLRKSMPGRCLRAGNFVRPRPRRQR